MKLRIVTLAEFEARLEDYLSHGVDPETVVTKDITSLANDNQPNAIIFVCYVNAAPTILTIRDEAGDTVILGSSDMTEALAMLAHITEYVAGVNTIDLRLTV
jgi:hypothetical protein